MVEHTDAVWLQTQFKTKMKYFPSFLAKYLSDINKIVGQFIPNLQCNELPNIPQSSQNGYAGFIQLFLPNIQGYVLYSIYF